MKRSLLGWDAGQERKSKEWWGLLWQEADARVGVVARTCEYGGGAGRDHPTVGPACSARTPFNSVGFCDSYHLAAKIKLK